ncbi:MAG: PQQ-binding-like beta-propeller repeat protein [Halothiobacillaceae bacterium]|nr:PQQ-binding-like beta-propeller repeat protein [Halothiobacillaceae bacterium]
MLVKLLRYGSAGLLLAGWTGTALAFGPTEWTQYRMGPEHNAVFEDGKDIALPDAHYRTSDQVRATPVIVDGRLYIGNHATGGLFAFSLEDGTALWSDNHPWFRHAPNWVHAETITDGKRLYVAYGNRVFQSAEVRGTGESGVMAVDPETGAPLWNHLTVGEVMPTPALWNGLLYAVTGAAELRAIDPETGTLAWKLKLPGWVSMSSPAVTEDGMLYVGTMDAVVGVDLQQREIVWRHDEIASFTDVPPAVGTDNVVVITAVKPYASATEEERAQFPDAAKGYLHFIYGFDAANGKLLWKDLLGSGPKQDNNTSGAPAIADGNVYVGSPYTKSVFAYDVSSGEKRWEHPTQNKVKGAPAIADGLVFFGDTSGLLYVVNAENGEALKRRNGNHLPTRDALERKNGPPLPPRKVGGSLSNTKNTALAPAGPVVIGDTLFIGSQDGYVYRISIPDWINQ